MNLRCGILTISLYLLILSSIFVPISHASWTQFALECLTRLFIVAVFATVTSIFLDTAAPEPYRVTDALRPAAMKEDVPPVELQPTCTTIQPHSPGRRRNHLLIFWIVVLAIYCVTQTSWWGRQEWVSRVLETAVQWAISLLCCGCLVFLWLPKPDANQPEPLHVVPSRNSNTDTSSLPN